MILQSLRFI